MSSKRIYQIAMILGILTLLVGWSVSQAADKITIKAVSAWPKTTYETENFMKLLEIVKAKVDKEAPGQFEIQFLGGPEVIPNMEQVEAARKGLVDLVCTTAGYYLSVVPEADSMTLSRIKSWEERAKGVNDLLNEIHQKKINCFYLGRIGTEIPFTIYLIFVLEACVTGDAYSRTCDQGYLGCGEIIIPKRYLPGHLGVGVDSRGPRLEVHSLAVDLLAAQGQLDFHVLQVAGRVVGHPGGQRPGHAV